MKSDKSVARLMPGDSASRGGFIAGYATISVAIIALAVLMVWNPDRFDPGIVVPLVGSMIGALGILMTVHQQVAAAQRQQSHEKALAHERTLQELRIQSVAQSQEAYDGFSEVFRDMLTNPDDQPDQAELRKRVMKMKFALLHYASNETIRWFSEWQKLATLGEKHKATEKPEFGAANLVFYARLIRSMRNDLGWPMEDMPEEAILRFFVTDIDQHLDRINQAKQWTQADQVPLE